MNKALTIAIVAITFLWAGMLCGISFLEAPLKFQAPGITLELGLGIGELVFGMLTKIEMVFALLIIAFLSLKQENYTSWLLFLIPITIVILDNALLMPILDKRIQLLQSGVTPDPSNAHLWYVILEVIKLISLLFAGSRFMSKQLKID